MKITLKDISFHYRTGNTKGHLVLENLNLELEEKKAYLLTGSCGSGKSTLAMLLKGLLLPVSGKISVRDCNMKLSVFQRSMGIVFQYPEEQFFKDTVFDEVAFGPMVFGLDKIEQRVKDAIRAVGLDSEQIGKLSPFILSSGEKRRLAIASVIACEPSWYIFDEPAAGLDLQGRIMIVKLIRNLLEKEKTIVIITQELGLFLDLCTDIIVLEKGMLQLKTDRKTFLEEERLGQMEISLPYHIRVLRELRSRGWNIPVAVTDPYEAVTIIEEYKM